MLSYKFCKKNVYDIAYLMDDLFECKKKSFSLCKLNKQVNGMMGVGNKRAFKS